MASSVPDPDGITPENGNQTQARDHEHAAIQDRTKIFDYDLED
jgi:hypothetical protein